MNVRIAEEIRDLLVDIETVHQYPGNPNSGDIDAVAESIEVNGFYSPILVQASTGYIVAGNTRYAAMLSLGATMIPARLVEMSDEQAKRILVVDNRTNRLGRDDDAALAELLDDLSGTDIRLLGTGFIPDDLDRLHTLLDEPLVIDIEEARPVEGAKQHAAAPITCPACGHEFGGAATVTPERSLT